MKCKLLVAEDELIERKVLCRTLQKYLGDLISLYEAKNGREALEIFAREAPQVAVLDIEMPAGWHPPPRIPVPASLAVVCNCEPGGCAGH